MTQNLNHGFTLFEVLVVFVILGLIFAIVPPFLPNVIENSQAKTATRELAANLKKARSLAISRQQETTLSLNIEKKTYALNQKTKKLNLPSTTSLSIITARSEQLAKNQGQIRFFPDGSSTGGQIKLTYRAKKYFIDVNWLTGNVQIFPKT